MQFTKMSAKAAAMFLAAAALTGCSGSTACAASTAAADCGAGNFCKLPEVKTTNAARLLSATVDNKDGECKACDKTVEVKVGETVKGKWACDKDTCTWTCADAAKVPMTKTAECKSTGWMVEGANINKIVGTCQEKSKTSCEEFAKKVKVTGIDSSATTCAVDSPFGCTFTAAKGYTAASDNSLKIDCMAKPTSDSIKPFQCQPTEEKNVDMATPSTGEALVCAAGSLASKKRPQGRVRLRRRQGEVYRQRD